TAPGCFDSLLAVLPRHDGSDCKALADIDGIFTLASGSCAGDELSIVTDRLGSLHIFFATVDSCLLFCTSSMVLAALLRPRWDLLACREFLATGTIFEQRSLFEGIEKLEPATLYRFRRGRLQSKVLYADLAQFMYDRSSMRGDVPQLAAALEDSIFTIGKNFSNPVCDLTGGFDSRAIVGAMLRSGFNFQPVVNGAPDLPDVLISKRIAEELGLRHMHQPSRITSPAELWE